MNLERMRRAAEWVLAATTVGCALVTLAVALRVIRAPYQLDFGEGEVLAGATRLAQGLNPYPDPHQWPVVLNVYGPLSYLLFAIPVKIAGVSFTGPRLLVLLSGLAVSLLVGLLIRRHGGSGSAAAAFGALFLCITVVYPWVVQLRVDMPALALALAGLYVFAAWPERWIWAAALFVAAIYCKWTIVAAPGACLLFLLGRREYKRAAQMAGLGLLLLGGIFGALEWATHGFFAFHMFGTHPDPYSLGKFLERFWRLVAEQWILAALSGAYVLEVARGRKLTLPILYIPLAMAGTATVGKMGANSNHLLEMAAALCLGAGLGWSALGRAAAQLRAANAAVAVFAVVLAGVFWQGYWFYKYPFTQRGCEAAYSFVRQQASERVLSGDVGAALLGGKPVMVSDPFAYTQLLKHRPGWNDAVEQKLREGYFDLVVSGSRAERWTDAERAALSANYRPVGSFYCTGAEEVYERREPGEKGR